MKFTPYLEPVNICPGQPTLFVARVAGELFINGCRTDIQIRYRCLINPTAPEVVNTWMQIHNEIQQLLWLSLIIKVQ